MTIDKTQPTATDQADQIERAKPDDGNPSTQQRQAGTTDRPRAPGRGPLFRK